MPNFTAEERTMLCLYDSGSLADTIATLEDMQREITRSEKHLLKLTASTLDKLAQITEDEYENLLEGGIW